MARILAIALAISLVLNGFFLGRMIGAPAAVVDAKGHPDLADVPHGEGRRGDDRRGGDRTISHLLGDIDELPPEARAILRDGFRARRESYLENRKREIGLRDKFAEALASEPFDRSGAEAAIAELYSARAERELAMAKVLIDVFEALPADKRSELVAASKDRRARRIEQWRERRGREGPEPRD